MQSTSPCDFLPWDTNFFGFRIARVVGHQLDPQRTHDILEWCKTQEIRCVYFLADSDHPSTVRLAEDNGFRQVDIRVTLQCDMRDRRAMYRNDSSEVANLRTALSKDIPTLQAIAGASHTDTRFYADPLFPRQSCQALYETWIKGSCEGDADVVLVAELEEQPVGYVSCHLFSNSSHGQIGLVGVASQAQGRGVGRALIECSLDWFAEQEVELVRIVTQGHNVPSQRLYQQCGFLSYSVQLWYHKWMPNC